MVVNIYMHYGIIGVLGLIILFAIVRAFIDILP